MQIKLKPVAWVQNSRTTSLDDDWGPVNSEIILAEDIPESAFQHILLDAINGTPILDIKPVYREFLPALRFVSRPGYLI